MYIMTVYTIVYIVTVHHMSILTLPLRYLSKPPHLHTEYFQNLLNLSWTLIGDETTSTLDYTSKTPSGERVFMLKTDLVLLLDPEYKAICQGFLGEPGTFLATFVSAWVKVMEQDMPKV
jgi:catalase (peroxidase I)